LGEVGGLQLGETWVAVGGSRGAPIGENIGSNWGEVGGLQLGKMPSLPDEAFGVVGRSDMGRGWGK